MRVEEQEPVAPRHAVQPSPEMAGRIVIRGQKPAMRCEICHQADLFNPETGECRRCANLSLPNLLQEFEPHDAGVAERSAPGSLRFRLLMSGLCAGSVIAANHLLCSGAPTADALIAMFFFVAAGAAYRLHHAELNGARWCEVCDAPIDSETGECQRCAAVAQTETLTPAMLAQAVGESPASTIRNEAITARTHSDGIRFGAKVILGAFGGATALCLMIALFGSRHPLVWLAPALILIFVRFLSGRQTSFDADERTEDD
jgi:hypothetical protein